LARGFGQAADRWFGTGVEMALSALASNAKGGPKPTTPRAICSGGAGANGYLLRLTCTALKARD
jgi:hypothetical protein